MCDIQDSDERNSFHIQISFNSLRRTISLRISNTNLLQYFLINTSFLINFSLQNYINFNLCTIFQIQHCLNCKENTVHHLHIISQKQWHSVKTAADWNPFMANQS
jgi:hypothetical protein